jgi:hypothetical protein
MDAALADDLGPADRTWILSNELIIRVSRGDEVDDQLAELRQLAEKHTDPHIAAAPTDTVANKALADGRFGEASRLWRESANVASYAPQASYQAGRAALWGRDLEGLRADLSRLDATGFHGPVVEARRTTLRAGVAALEGRVAEALSAYKEALAAWRALRMAWDEALTGIDMASSLDPTMAEVRAAAEASRDVLTRLEAKPYLAMLDQALSRDDQRAPSSGTPQAAGVESGPTAERELV